MGAFLRDVRYALRSLVRQPGVSLVIVLTLAVGIGANTGIFALLIDVYAARFPAPEPERLFYVRTGTPERPFGLSSQPDAADYREALKDLGDVASWIGFGSVVGLRLDEGATRQAAAARLEVVAGSLDAEHPWPNGAERRVSLRGVEERGPGSDVGALMVMTAMGLLLLLACANVANLLLVRAAGRQREIAVMAAIGAGRRHIAARLLLESVTLSILGGLLGLGVARPLVDPDLALAEVATYDDVRVFDLQSSRALGAISGLFSLFGLGVACLGIYSVMSCSVSYRVREIGIRMALGADARDVVRLVLGEAGGLVTAGVLLGVAAALAVTRLLSSLLYGVGAHDPWTFLTLPVLLVAVALAAAWLPARRAGSLDPKTALLEE